jgi:hypothetical protein
VGATAEDQAMAQRVLAWSLQEMQITGTNQFFYQKNQNFTNRINYIRWTQAWVYFAFAFYQRHLEGSHE